MKKNAVFVWWFELITIIGVFCAAALICMDVAWADELPILLPKSESEKVLLADDNSNTMYGWSDVTYDVYVFFSGSSHSNLYIVSEDTSAISYIKVNNNNTLSGHPYGQYDSNTNLYWWNYDAGWVSAATRYAPTYDSYLYGLADVRNLIDNGYPEPEPSVSQAEYTIPSGCVAFIRTGGNSYISSVYTTRNQNVGGTFQNTANTFNNQYYGFASSLPSGNVTFPTNDMNLIEWFIVNSAPKDLMGGTNQIFGQWNASSTQIYTVIYNPYYQRYEESRSGFGGGSVVTELNNEIIFKGYFSEVKLYKLHDGATVSAGSGVGDISSGSLDEYNNPLPAVNDNGVVTQYDEYGNVVTSIPNGGDNLTPINQQNNGIINSINNAINSLIEKIEGIFDVGHGAISTLVSAAQGFISKFALLYSWMPTEVYNVVIAAVIIAVTIGIFKVFL